LKDSLLNKKHQGVSRLIRYTLLFFPFQIMPLETTTPGNCPGSGQRAVSREFPSVCQHNPASKQNSISASGVLGKQPFADLVSCGGDG